MAYYTLQKLGTKSTCGRFVDVCVLTPLLLVLLLPSITSQIRAIHPRESMHFSTKERVPLLVCLEVQHVRVPTAAARFAAKAGRKQIPTTVSAGGHSTEAVVLVVEGEGDSKGGRQESEGGAGHAGEAGLMERFRGTVRSFVKVG